MSSLLGWFWCGIAFAMLSGIACGERRDCDFVALKRQADLDASSFCVISSDCQVLGCGLSRDEEVKLLDENDESYLFWIEPVRKRKEENAIRKAHGRQLKSDWEPRISIIIKGYTELGFHALVDSGAFVLVLPYEIGKKLQFEKSKDEHAFEAFGVASSIKGYARDVDIEIDGEEYERIQSLWCDKNHDTDSLLIGRANIFRLFTIVMDETEDLVEFIPKDKQMRKNYLTKKKTNVLQSVGIKYEL